MNIDDICKIFEWGVDYGLLLAEQERDGEDMGAALVCAVMTPRTCLPTFPTHRRQPHSEAWRQAKKDSLINLIEYVKGSGAL